MILSWLLYVAPKTLGAQKTQNGRFSSKIALRVKKVGRTDGRTDRQQSYKNINVTYVSFSHKEIVFN